MKEAIVPISPLLSAEIPETGNPLSLVLLTKNDCVQCTGMKRSLHSRKVNDVTEEINVEELDDKASEKMISWIKDTFGPRMPLSLVFDSVTGQPVAARSGNRPDLPKDLAERRLDRGLVHAPAAVGQFLISVAGDTII